MTLPGFRPHNTGTQSNAVSAIERDCDQLAIKKNRHELGSAIAVIVLAYSLRDLERMRWNFTGKIKNIDPVYRKCLEETITGYLYGVYQNIRLMSQQGAFSSLSEPVPDDSGAFWAMVSAQCRMGEEEDRLRFLKFLLAGFCMLVQGLPGHPVGMPFPGGDKIELIDGTYYCPARIKAGDVDAALCPFCPARQTPEIGYLRPPVDASRHRKQEFIKNCYDFHNFNG